MEPIVLPGWIVAACTWGVLVIVGLALLAGALALAVWLAEKALRKAQLLRAAAMFTYCYHKGYRFDDDGTWWSGKVRIKWVGGWPWVRAPKLPLPSDVEQEEEP